MRKSGQGFNALNGSYEDLMAAGIVDAAKVVRLAVQDSVSIASLLITTEVVIADKPEPEAPAPEGGGDPMGGMGGMECRHGRYGNARHGWHGHARNDVISPPFPGNRRPLADQPL